MRFTALASMILMAATICFSGATEVKPQFTSSPTHATVLPTILQCILNPTLPECRGK